tara:strand:- start:100 stop:378 length:279 start_codon:yes stop_codon:yes gene_type:complete
MLTELETKVLVEIEEICNDDYSASVNEIAQNLEMPKPQVKGVISSLDKKEKITIGDLEIRDGIKFKDIWLCRPAPDKDSLCKWEILSWGEWS